MPNLEDLFGVVFSVPSYNQSFNLGDMVTWRVEPKRKGGVKPFVAEGKIVKLYVSTFGSRIKKQAAKVETFGEYLTVFPSRRHTTVAVDKLKHLSARPHS